ncbi:hypothetical protein H2509_12310 [Stappia sp. F7233]|uniref:Secreted protein n=1 Tax=Stappia albiluteola TaxID=2758565 RepID=A0A839AFP0_9HYPH|nr:hypothetical protein [Stappia albiluteola]MBA5777906.1 hypothetical protein [Stappia albiluteola]
MLGKIARHNHIMHRPLFAAVLLALGLQPGAVSAAGWETADGTAFTHVDETNSTIVALSVQCDGEMNLEVFSANDGPILNSTLGATGDFHYQPGKVQGEIDGEMFPLAAAGSEWSTVILSEGGADDNYLSPLTAPFVAALRGGTSLVLRFDLLPDRAPDGSPFETAARFSLQGAAAAMDSTGSGCH